MLSELTLLCENILQVLCVFRHTFESVRQRYVYVQAPKHVEKLFVMFLFCLFLQPVRERNAIVFLFVSLYSFFDSLSFLLFLFMFIDFVIHFFLSRWDLWFFYSFF